jgi:hypothetical protein
MHYNLNNPVSLFLYLFDNILEKNMLLPLLEAFTSKTKVHFASWSKTMQMLPVNQKLLIMLPLSTRMRNHFGTWNLFSCYCYSSSWLFAICSPFVPQPSHIVNMMSRHNLPHPVRFNSTPGIRFIEFIAVLMLFLFCHGALRHPFQRVR